MAEAETEIERILVALDAGLPGDSLLEAAARLAALAHAELTALFVEDADVLQLAALPFARELDRASAALRVIEPRSLERAMAAQARHLQRCVEALSERHGIRASLRVLRGVFATSVLAEAAERDIVFVSVGSPARISSRQRGMARAVAGARFDAPGDAPICVYFDNTPSAQRALRLARGWARQWGRRLWILAVPAEETGAAADQADEAGAERVALTGGGEQPLRELLVRAPCALLVLPRSWDGARLRRGGFLDAVSCPVLLVN
jgi:nucleotide-binding universal stress UspA family protein